MSSERKSIRTISGGDKMGSRENGYINYGGYNANLQGTYPSRQNYNIPPQTFGSGNIPMMVHDTHSIDLKCPNCMGNRILDNANMVLKAPTATAERSYPPNLSQTTEDSSAYPNPHRSLYSPTSPTIGSPSNRIIRPITHARWVFRKADMYHTRRHAKGAHCSGFWVGLSSSRCR